MATKKVRILADCLIDGVAYKSNQLVEIDAEIVKPHIKEGNVDAAKDAVDYCLSEGVELVTHVSPAAEDAPAAEPAAEAVVAEAPAA